MMQTNGKEVENNNPDTTETTLNQAQNSQNLTEKALEKRQKLFQYLDNVLETSKEKFNKKKALNAERQRWGKLILAAVDSYNRLLCDAELPELDDLRTQLDILIEERKVLRNE